MGASEDVREALFSRLALTCFVIGFLMVGVLKAWILHGLYAAFKAWKNEVSQYYTQKLGYSVLRKNDNERTGKDRGEFVLGYIFVIEVISF